MKKLRDWSIRRWLLLIGALFVLLIVGARLHLKWKVDRAVAEIRKSGMPTRYVDLNEGNRVEAGTENFATALTNALAMFSEPSEEEMKRLPFWGRADNPAPGSSWPDGVKELLTDYYEENAAAMESLRSALSLTNACLFNDYDPKDWGISALIQTRKAANHLTVSGLIRAENGDPDAAIDELIDAFRITDLMLDEPALISHMVRIGNDLLILGFVERVLSRGDEAGAESLRRLATVLETGLGRESLQEAITGERVYFLEPAYYHNGDNWVTEEMMFEPEKGTLEYQIELAKLIGYRMSGFADQDILNFLEASKRLEAVSILPVLEQQRFVTNYASFLSEHTDLRFGYWSKAGFAIYEGVVEANVRRHSKFGAALAGVAVLQFRLANEGRLPGSLDELIPGYLKEAPVEPVSGEPFKLIVEKNGFGIGRGAPEFRVRFTVRENAR